MTDAYLSICIPTNGRIDILKNTLDSIYTNCDANISDFEVVLSDNSNNEDLLNLLKDYIKYPNILYSKTTCEGFLNSVNALKMGRGLFLKLHNNYTMFNKGGLSQMISFIKSEIELKPLVFFSNGEFKKFNVRNYNSFDAFTHALSFWNTWSTGFSIWRNDFESYSDTKLNKMFPQVSLILLQNKKKSFIINDYKVFVNQDVKKKGGYNLFETFGVDYLKLLDEAKEQKHITLNTFEKIKYDLYYNFLVDWYYNTKIAKNDYTFDLTNIRKNISVYYSPLYYFKLVILGYVLSFKIVIGHLLKALKFNK